MRVARRRVTTLREALAEAGRLRHCGCLGFAQFEARARRPYLAMLLAVVAAPGLVLQVAKPSRSALLSPLHSAGHAPAPKAGRTPGTQLASLAGHASGSCYPVGHRLERISTRRSIPPPDRSSGPPKASKATYVVAADRWRPSTNLTAAGEVGCLALAIMHGG